MGKRRKPVTIEDIAKRARVAHSTVSMVMNERKYVSQRLREKILKIAQEMDYQPNLIARSLISHRSQAVAVVFPESPYFFTITYFLQIINGIQNACKKYNQALMFFSLDQTKGESYIQISRRWLVNLMILINVDYTRNISRDIKDLQKASVYFSIITKYLGEEKVNSVCVDNDKGVKLALQHLVSLGHKRIGYISGNPNSADGPERLEAFKKYIKEFNLDKDEDLIVHGEFTFESGEEAVKGLLELPKKPTAIFSASDYMAIGAMRTMKKKGLRIPQDIALVGFDNALEAAYVEPPLTTIQQPLQEMGEVAVDLAFNSMKDPDFIPQTVIKEPSLIIRRSCGAES
jgi:DNA-binding LacI/PurR family transcriptional regulator